MQTDKWIIGESAYSTVEYIIHTENPRFIAKLWDSELGDNPNLSQLVAVIPQTNDELYDFIWLDYKPSDIEIAKLAKLIGEAIIFDSLK